MGDATTAESVSELKDYHCVVTSGHLLNDQVTFVDDLIRQPTGHRHRSGRDHPHDAERLIIQDLPVLRIKGRWVHVTRQRRDLQMREEGLLLLDLVRHCQPAKDPHPGIHWR